MLILFYNFIPNRIYIERKLAYSLLVGLIFSFATIMGILIPWTGTSHPSIGINGVLVPLAGSVGGPVSAVIVTVILLLTKIPLDSWERIPDMLIIIIAGIIGSSFYYFRKKRIIRLSPVIELFILSSLFATLTYVILVYFHSRSTGRIFDPPFPFVQISAVIFIGLFLLGWIIHSIDRKKESEFELFCYKDHLENLVQDRTADLERVNSLQEATIESTGDGIVVTDLDGGIQGCNQAARNILGIIWDDPLQQYPDIYHLIHEQVETGTSSPPLATTAPSGESPVITSLTFTSGKTYELSVTPYRLFGTIIGRVLNFRDITDRKQAEEVLKKMNQKLLLLSEITRHDILNQLTVLHLYLQMVRDEVHEGTVTDYLEKMQQTLGTMQVQTEFTRDYQDIGLHEPLWQNPNEAFMSAAQPFQDLEIVFSCQGEEVEIYADPLLQRAFYNLIDNSIRHGGRITSISLSSNPSASSLILRYRDDGTGVAPEEKDKIFVKGFGKHTGFGMFLIKEILSITGIQIHEAGMFGEGVLFEILVPADAWRRNGGDNTQNLFSSPSSEIP